MTYGEIYDKFNSVIKGIGTTVNDIDFRPIEEMYCSDLKYKPGIRVWLSNGDTLLYFPKELLEDQK